MRWQGETFLAFETDPRPHDLHHGAVIGKGAVGKRNLGAGSLQQGSGDEDAKPEPGAPLWASSGARRRDR